VTKGSSIISQSQKGYFWFANGNVLGIKRAALASKRAQIRRREN